MTMSSAVAGTTGSAMRVQTNGSPSMNINMDMEMAVGSGMNMDMDTMSPVADASADTVVPCEVSAALANACHVCHGRVPANGAPMSLVEPADFQRLRIVRPRISFAEAALMRMNGTKSPPMPPAEYPISEEDKTTLIDWLGQGAPAISRDAATCL